MLSHLLFAAPKATGLKPGLRDLFDGRIHRYVSMLLRPRRHGEAAPPAWQFAGADSGRDVRSLKDKTISRLNACDTILSPRGVATPSFMMSGASRSAPMLSNHEKPGFYLNEVGELRDGVQTVG